MAKFSKVAPPPKSASEWVNVPHAEEDDPTAVQTTPLTRDDIDTGIGMSAKGPRSSSAEEQQKEQACEPWERFDRRAACKKLFNLRLTEFHWAILSHLHAEEDGERSIQKIIHDILLPELERRVGVEPRRKRSIV